MTLEDRGWAVWDAAWDEAREEDKRLGRRYDRTRYAEAAHLARLEFLESRGKDVS